MTDAERARLRALIAERSFSADRAVTLASGRASNFYFNMKPTMMSAEGARLIARAVLARLEGAGVDYVGGLEMGAVPIAAAVAAVSAGEGRPVDAFFVRKAAKEHGAKALIEGPPEDKGLKGARVAVLEDVTTTGGSALKAIETIRETGAEIARVITIVDREEGAAAAFAAANLPFEAIFRARDFS